MKTTSGQHWHCDLCEKNDWTNPSALRQCDVTAAHGDIDMDAWHPPTKPRKGGRPRRDEVVLGPYEEPEALEAIAVCRTCPFQASCLEEAIEREWGSAMPTRTYEGNRHGIWGGATPLQRWEVEQARRAAETPSAA